MLDNSRPSPLEQHLMYILYTSAMLVYRAEYNPDQYLWERDFTLAGRTYIRQDLEASMDMSYHLPGNCRFYFAEMFNYIMVPEPAILYFENTCSSQMLGDIHCIAVIICLHLSPKMLLFLVLYTVMETGM